LSWMISHAAWHLVLLLSLQICAGTWTETTNCKFCPCPQQILLFQYMVRDIPYNIIAADQYRCATSSEFYLPLESLLKPNEFERNLAVPLALIGSNKGPHRDVSVPSSTGEFDLHLHRGPVGLTSCLLPSESPGFRKSLFKQVPSDFRDTQRGRSPKSWHLPVLQVKLLAIGQRSVYKGTYNASV
jgi:hypothetical protein